MSQLILLTLPNKGLSTMLPNPGILWCLGPGILRLPLENLLKLPRLKLGQLLENIYLRKIA